MSTQSTANATLKALLTCLVDQQQSQQAQLNAIKDTFKANKDEGAVFEGDEDDMPRFLPMLRNWATEQKALRIKEGAGVTPKRWEIGPQKDYPLGSLHLVPHLDLLSLGPGE
ncbi:hypothetical protein PQX77_016769 [Marasmius sp. AFHP31]|nr:hypothetical protein PQX77_016769 [Marasmius sp. AFHP31]